MPACGHYADTAGVAVAPSGIDSCRNPAAVCSRRRFFWYSGVSYHFMLTCLRPRPSFLSSGPIGAHAFSGDGGRTFHSFCSGSDPAQLHPIYNATTRFADGSTKLLHFERPKIVLDPVDGAPVALFASVGSHCNGVVDDRSWTIARPIRHSGALEKPLAPTIGTSNSQQ